MLDYILKYYEQDNGQGEGVGTSGEVESDGDGNQPEEPEVEPTQVDAEEIKTKTKNEVLRDLSKELGINVFEAEGLQKVKSLIDSQKTEQEKMQEQLSKYEEQQSQWEKERLEYQSKLKASELGIHPDNMEDALKLAEGKPENLANVVKKYPMFKTKEGIKIGVQNPSNATQPNDKSEAEAFMARDPRYKNYINKK